MRPIGMGSFINFFARIRFLLAGIFKKVSGVLHLSPINWKWISFGSLLSIILFSLGFALFLAASLTLPWIIISALAVLTILLLIGLAVKLGLILVNLIPKRANWLIASSIAMVYMFFFAPVPGLIIIYLFMVLTFMLVFGALSNILSNQWKALLGWKRAVNLAMFIIGTGGILVMVLYTISPGTNKEPLTNYALQSAILPEQLRIEDPSLPGDFEIQFLTYGSQTDRRRAEFGKSADMVSEVVDGSSFVDGWEGFSGKIRSRFWGFESDSLPLNARVWIPEGTGPFPMVMMVHGNHLDRDFSDGGYDYLGEHFATQGMVAVSVDENFLNSGLANIGNSLKGENDARGWLLLKHLEQWEKWNEDSLSPLFGKADMNNIVLIGHSRGGEAVSVAACFNDLPYFPDNFREKFDFHFGIRGVVAIAQVDGQYKPANIPTPVENVNFLAIQGSLDADMESFLGLRQLYRVKFTDSVYHFKTGIFIHGANHGQFNTAWGKNDIGYPSGLLLDRKNMLKREEQEKIALTYITAFLKVNFGMDSAYIPFFKDYRTGREWLPETVYVNQFEDNREHLWCDFEEDIDLTTTSLPGIKSDFSNLSQLREEHISLRWEKLGTRAVIIGWNNEKDSVPGNYSLVFTDTLSGNFSGYENFIFTVAALDQDPGERKQDTIEEDVEAGKIEESGEEIIEEEVEEAEDEEYPLDFTIFLKDASGNTTGLELGSYHFIQPPIKPRIYKNDIFTEDPNAETIPQYITIALKEFSKENPDFDLRSVREIDFVFDKTERGVVLLDNIGLAEPW